MSPTHGLSFVRCVRRPHALIRSGLLDSVDYEYLQGMTGSPEAQSEGFFNCRFNPA
jgi:hypothetical protein